MMWILVWMQLVTSQGVEYYQLGTFTKEADCQEALSKAVVLVNTSAEMLACLEVDTRQ
jgi:hypothetical protein|tara:strand:- start:2841 stop:3014 length:174 start_codon:yes stop_codon:yes gene_type:complete